MHVGHSLGVVPSRFVPRWHTIRRIPIRYHSRLYLINDLKICGVWFLDMVSASQGVVYLHRHTLYSPDFLSKDLIVDCLKSSISRTCTYLCITTWTWKSAAGGSLLSVRCCMIIDDFLTTIRTAENITPHSVVNVNLDAAGRVTGWMPSLVHPTTLFLQFIEDARRLQTELRFVNRCIQIVSDERGNWR